MLLESQLEVRVGPEVQIGSLSAAIRAAWKAAVQYDLVVDNLGVQKKVDIALQGGLKTQQYSFAQYKEITGYSVLGSRCRWIPSHNKENVKGFKIIVI